MRGAAIIPNGYIKFKHSSHSPFTFLLLLRLFSVRKDLIPPPRSRVRCSLIDPLHDFFLLLRTSSRALPETSSLHCRAFKSGFTVCKQVTADLLHLYTKCGSMDHVRKLFEEMPQKDVIAWTILLTACVRSKGDESGLTLFSRMLEDGVVPNRFTLSSVFKCCSKENGDLELGKSIHGWMIRNGIEMDIVLQNSILDFYVKSEAFEYAGRVFEKMTERDAVSWNVMIGSRIKLGDMNGAMELFRASPYRDASSWNTFISGQIQIGSEKTALQLLNLMAKIGPSFNQYTFSISIVLAAKLALLDLGKQIHSKLVRLGFENDGFIKNSLVNMYSKCGKMEASSTIFFDDVQGFQKNAISWSTLIAGFVQSGSIEEALALFCRMLHDGAKVDPFTLTSIASACADAGILEQGRQIHSCVEKSGHGFDVFLASAVIDMYAKCGRLDDARKVFATIDCKNVVLWTSMISSYALHGEAKEAIKLFEMMLDKKIIPNEISFIGILSACSHEGLIKEGYKYFNLMQKDHGIVPKIEHLNCMVHLLGRHGKLNDAKNFIFEHNLRHHGVVLKSLILACRVHGDLETARWASEQLVQIEPHEAGSYVLLSRVHAIKNEWEEASMMWNLMKDKGVKKKPGRSWIQLKGKIHSFVAGDKSHPEFFEIISYLQKLVGRLKELGYSTRTDFVLHDVGEEQREMALQLHSEKLAIAYGIINTSNGLPLMVMKNLRVCGDCHEAIKYISQATNREIVLRDAYRFHRFKNGMCSCRDYW